MANRQHFRASALALAVGSTFTAFQPLRAAEAALEEIQVTGSRIRLTDGMAQPTPVTAVTVDEMRGFDPASSVSEQLDNLPQFLNTQTAQRGGGTLFGDAAGSYLNLRNMGKQRTLVLFDGSRIVPADRAGVPNVDNFPTALIRNVDVVTGGASAAYGADAMAGVVNFVLDREFEGFKSSVSTGITERGDGFNYNFSLAGGKRLGERLHLIGSLEHRNIEQILRKPQDLDNWNSIGWVINPAWRATDPRGTNPQRLTLPHVHHANQNPAGIVSVTGPLGNQFRFQNYTFTDDGRAMRPFVVGDYRNLGNGMQAGGPEAAISERAFDGAGGLAGNEVVQHSAFAGFKYDVSDATNVFGQVMLGRTESNGHDRRGNPEMGAIYTATVYRQNAFLPPELAAEMDRLGLQQVNFAKIGQVRTNNNNNFYDDRDNADIAQMWSASVGFEHLFDNTWSLRGNYQYGESGLTSESKGIIRVDHWFMAMDAVRDPSTGAIVCNVQLRNPSIAELEAAAAGKTVLTTRVTEYPSGRMPIDNILVTPERSIRDCQPMNVFGLGNVDDAADAYVLSDDKKGIRDLDQHFAELLLTGNLHEGWGAGPLGFAAGLTWREEWFNQITRPIDFERTTLNAPEVGIRGIPSQISEGNRSVHQFSATSWATGEFDVWEWFAEMNVPIWEAASGEQRLDSNFAFRQSDYSHSGKVDSWKAGLELQVFQDLRLRVTQSRDVREPTFQEQFEAQGGGGQVNDPLMGINNQTITLLTYGNANLKPEEADTLTAGIVYAPTFAGWLEGFQISADYYDIDVSGRITPLGAQRLVDECVNGSSPAFCSQLIRNPTTNILERVEDRQVNAAAGVTRGVDIEVRYSHDIDFISDAPEDVNLRLFANKAIENSVTTTTFRNDVGSLTSPEWNATAMLGYTIGDAALNWITRYYDSTTYTNGFGVFWADGIDVDDSSIASQTVHNMVLSYRGETSSGANWVASLNVNNVFDRDPPVVASQSTRGGQQNPSNVFDVFGRRYQLSLNYSF